MNKALTKHRIHMFTDISELHQDGHVLQGHGDVGGGQSGQASHVRGLETEADRLLPPSAEIISINLSLASGITFT